MKIIQDSSTHNHKHAKFAANEFNFVRQITAKVVEYNSHLKSVPSYAISSQLTVYQNSLGTFNKKSDTQFVFEQQVFNAEDKK